MRTCFYILTDKVPNTCKLTEGHLLKNKEVFTLARVICLFNKIDGRCRVEAYAFVLALAICVCNIQMAGSKLKQ